MSYDLRVWEKAQEGEVYVLGGDVAEGLNSGDSSVLQCRNVRTGNQAAELEGKIGPFELAELASMLGEVYNQALVGIENPPGLGDGGANRHLFDIGYRKIYFEQQDVRQAIDRPTPRLGMAMNHRLRGRLVPQGRRWVEDGSAIINSERLIGQWETFALINGKYQAVPGAHDDLVMGDLIAIELMRIVQLTQVNQERMGHLPHYPGAESVKDLSLPDREPTLVDRLVEKQLKKQKRERMQHSPMEALV